MQLLKRKLDTKRKLHTTNSTRQVKPRFPNSQTRTPHKRSTTFGKYTLGIRTLPHTYIPTHGNIKQYIYF